MTTIDNEIRDEADASPRCCRCGHPLWAPQSITRGHCEACEPPSPEHLAWIARKAGGTA